MASIGEAAARGLESGFGMGLRYRQQQNDEDYRKRQQDRLDRQEADQQEDRQFARQRMINADNRQAKLDERQDDEVALKAVDAEREMLRGEMGGLYRQYGSDDKIPEDVRSQYKARANEINSRRSDLLRRRYAPVLERQQQAAKNILSRLQAGSLNLDEVDDGDFYRAVAIGTRRNPEDFLSQQPGKPSAVARTVDDAMAGLETNNPGLLVEAANKALEPELKIGIGQQGKDGSEIVDKKLEQLLPDPRDPSRVLPVIRVTVKRADGAIGSYLAPITRNRSSDPDDVVDSIPISSMMQYAGNLRTLGTALDIPDVRAKLERGKPKAEADVKDFLSAYYALGGKAADLRKTTSREKLDLGDRVLDREIDETGAIIGEKELRKGAPPRVFPPRSGGAGGRGGVGGTIAAIQAFAEENGIDFEEAAEQLQSAGVLRSSGKSKGPSESEIKGVVRDAEMAAARDLGLLGMDKKTGKWMQRDGTPATAEQVQRIQAAGESASRTVRDNAAAGKRTGASEAIDAARDGAKNERVIAAPPANFKAKGRDTASDFKTVQDALAKGADRQKLAENLRKAGYPIDAINAVMSGGSGGR